MSSASTVATTPKATSAAKMPRQPPCASTNVPKNGAAAGPMRMNDCRQVIAVFRSDPENASFTIAVSTVVTAPYPSASPMRKSTSPSTLGASMHPSEDAVNSAEPNTKTGLRPRRSLSGPANTTPTAPTAKNANMVRFR